MLIVPFMKHFSNILNWSRWFAQQHEDTHVLSPGPSYGSIYWWVGRFLFQMLGGAVGLPTSAAAAASAAAVAVAAHKQFHPNSPPLDLDSWKEVFLQQANTNGNNTKNNVSSAYMYLLDG